MIDSISLVMIVSDFLKAPLQRGNLNFPGYNTEIDPYAKFACLEKKIPEPIALIESEDEIFTSKSMASVHSSKHKLIITCIVNTIGKSFIEYRMEAQRFANNIRAKLEHTSSTKVQLSAQGQTPGEFMVGNIKCSGMIIEYEVQ